MTRSVFADYYTPRPFADRYAVDPRGAIDVIVPTLHVTEVWEENLKSFYREIPVRTLRIGDAGMPEAARAIAARFPRVAIVDHSAYTSLGYSIRRLIEDVETEWFAYLQSDVYLPEGWFDAMARRQGEFDWFGARMRITALVEYDYDHGRPYAGSQMGRKAAFLPALSRVDDDFVYRREDYIFEEIVRANGFRCGKVDETFHYHQVMDRAYAPDSRYRRKILSVDVRSELSAAEEARTWWTETKGTIKYLPPTEFHRGQLAGFLANLERLGLLDWMALRAWTLETRPEWLAHLEHPAARRRREFAGRIFARLRRLIGWSR